MMLGTAVDSGLEAAVLRRRADATMKMGRAREGVASWAERDRLAPVFAHRKMREERCMPVLCSPLFEPIVFGDMTY